MVRPQAIDWLWPMTTPGIPAKVKPETSNGQAAETVRQCRPVWYQIPGMAVPRCGSLASSGLPVVVFDPATTQELEPMPSPRPRRAGIESSAAWALSNTADVTDAERGRRRRRGGAGRRPR